MGGNDGDGTVDELIDPETGRGDEEEGEKLHADEYAAEELEKRA
jgi:hypothetical protein